MWWFSAMSSNRNREEFGPVTRNRSSSANEASKPILVLQRRQTHIGNKPLNFSPSNASNDGKSFLDLFFFLCFYAIAIWQFYQQKWSFSQSLTIYVYYIPHHHHPPCPIWIYIYNSPVKVKVTKIEKNRKKKKRKNNRTNKIIIKNKTRTQFCPDFYQLNISIWISIWNLCSLSFLCCFDSMASSMIII